MSDIIKIDNLFKSFKDVKAVNDICFKSRKASFSPFSE